MRQTSINFRNIGMVSLNWLSSLFYYTTSVKVTHSGPMILGRFVQVDKCLIVLPDAVRHLSTNRDKPGYS